MNVNIKLRVVTAIVSDEANVARTRLIACSVFRTIQSFSVIGMYFYRGFGSIELLLQILYSNNNIMSEKSNALDSIMKVMFGALC